ncbi:hypothetical protein CRUP_027839 [Coryphaenoides rupestris]|nr:hypothetical protein CRUP_027839 [Coryphaenoides rupestris]
MQWDLASRTRIRPAIGGMGGTDGRRGSFVSGAAPAGPGLNCRAGSGPSSGWSRCQWIERRHMFLYIGLVWLYTVFWASLPTLGFGSYGPEPHGTSCTVNWWRIRSSLSDRIYIFLILTLCFGVPAITIIASYTTILLMVYRSTRALASIPFCSVIHTSSKDLRLTKMAAVVCASFLVAWMPYAAVSLYSALVQGGDEDEPGESSWVRGVPSLFNCTWAWPGRDDPYSGSTQNWDQSPPCSSAPGQRGAAPETKDPLRPSVPPIPPMAGLILVLLAKSHCMFNPFIQIMNPEFRQDAHNAFSCCGRRGSGGAEGSCHESEQHSPRRQQIFRQRSREMRQVVSGEPMPNTKPCIPYQEQPASPNTQA